MAAVHARRVRRLGASLLAACGLLLAGGVRAQALLDPAQAFFDHRPAATAVLARHATLSVLEAECARLLPQVDSGASALARRWLVRNQPLLEANVVWIERFLGPLRGRDPAAFRKATAALVDGAGQQVQQEVRALFARRLPDAASCRAAFAPFERGDHDLQPAAGAAQPQPQPQPQREYLALLRQIRAEPAFLVPPHLRPMIDPGPRYGLVASAEAALAARERGDGRAAADIYLSMANRGDGAAAQTLGVLLLEGKLLPPDALNAYRWFYIAWTLGDQEGLNALGAMLRDGLAVSPQPGLAYAAFSIAAARAATPATAVRAAGNATELARSLPAAERQRVACMTLERFAAELRQPVDERDLASGRSLAGGGRRLGEIAPALAGGGKLACQPPP